MACSIIRYARGRSRIRAGKKDTQRSSSTGASARVGRMGKGGCERKRTAGAGEERVRGRGGWEEPDFACPFGGCSFLARQPRARPFPADADVIMQCSSQLSSQLHFTFTLTTCKAWSQRARLHALQFDHRHPAQCTTKYRVLAINHRTQCTGDSHRIHFV